MKALIQEIIARKKIKITSSIKKKKHWNLWEKNKINHIYFEKSRSGTHSFNPLTTWLAPTDNQFPPLGGVQKSAH